MPITEIYESRRITRRGADKTYEIDVRVDSGNPEAAVLDPAIPAMFTPLASFLTASGGAAPTNVAALAGVVLQNVSARGPYAPSATIVTLTFSTMSGGRASSLSVDSGAWEIEFDTARTTVVMVGDFTGVNINPDLEPSERIVHALEIRYRTRVSVPPVDASRMLVDGVNAAPFQLAGMSIPRYQALYIGMQSTFTAPEDYTVAHTFLVTRGVRAIGGGFTNEPIEYSGHQFISEYWSTTQAGVLFAVSSQYIRQTHETVDFAGLNLQPGLPEAPE